MKKILSLALLTILVFTALSLVSCGLIDKLNGAVTYPETYSITYQITTAEGSIYEMTKSVDGDGNVYLKTQDSEELYINDGRTYTLYKKDANGDFKQSDSVKYTKKAVDNATSGISEYAEQSKNKFMPTAKKDGETALTGRACEIYKLGVGTDGTGSYHYYYVDKETGICLGVDVSQAALGEKLENQNKTFICTEFITDGVEDLSLQIA